MRPKEVELCVKSSESGGVPWVQLKAVILCIAKAIGSSGKDFIYDEGALPFGFELILFLLQEAYNKFSDVVCFGPHFSTLVTPGLLLIEC